MRLNLRQIEAFRAVYQTGGMTAAGNLMNITQPAVSRLIRDLEAETGLSLFVREGVSIAPPPDATACGGGVAIGVRRPLVELGALTERYTSFQRLEYHHRDTTDHAKEAVGSHQAAARCCGLRTRGWLAHSYRSSPLGLVVRRLLMMTNWLAASSAFAARSAAAAAAAAGCCPAPGKDAALGMGRGRQPPEGSRRCR